MSPTTVHSTAMNIICVNNTLVQGNLNHFAAEWVNFNSYHTLFLNYKIMTQQQNNKLKLLQHVKITLTQN